VELFFTASLRGVEAVSLLSAENIQLPQQWSPQLLWNFTLVNFTSPVNQGNSM
jgi:hypothetical protein